MLWWVCGGTLYVMALAAICLFFKGAAILNEKLEAFENAALMDRRLFVEPVTLFQGPTIISSPENILFDGSELLS